MNSSAVTARSNYHAAIQDAKRSLPPWALLLSLFVIVGLVASIFGQTGSFEFVDWDDGEYIGKNPKVLGGLSLDALAWSLTSFEVTNWHPVTWWSYLLDISLFGPNPGAMHLVNVLFHALNSLLVGALLMRFGQAWIPALLGAAIFAAHPLHVESVAWISERKDVLAAFFLLLVLLSWDRYVRRGGVLNYGLSLGFAVLGLMAKPMLVTLPCLLLVLDLWPYGRLRSSNQPWFRDRQLVTLLVEKLPFALFAAVCAWLTLRAQGAGGSMRTLEQIDVSLRLGSAIHAYATYILKTIVPTSQYFMYLRTPLDPLWVIISLAALIGFSWWALYRRGATLAGWLWFLISLIPVIGLVTVGDQARADRYMYIPMIGLLLMLVDAMRWQRLLENPEEVIKLRAVLVAASCAVLILAFLAHRYTGYWRDSETLFQRALAFDPKHCVANGHLANLYERRGQPKLAIMHADLALGQSLSPDFIAGVAISGSNAALSLGNLPLAKTYLEMAIAANPRHPKSYYNMGTLALKSGDLVAAKGYFEQAISLKRDYSEAYNNLGAVQLLLGHVDEASSALTESLRLDPSNEKARNNLMRIKGGQLW